MGVLFELSLKVADLNFGCATFCALPSFGAVTTFSSLTTSSSHKTSVKGSDIDMCSTKYFLFDHPSAFSRRAVVSYWRKNVHELLINRLGGLSMPRKSVVRLTDHPDMTLDVYRGRKTTMQQQQQLSDHITKYCTLYLCPHTEVATV